MPDIAAPAAGPPRIPEAVEANVLFIPPITLPILIKSLALPPLYISSDITLSKPNVDNIESAEVLRALPANCPNLCNLLLALPPIAYFFISFTQGIVVIFSGFVPFGIADTGRYCFVVGSHCSIIGAPKLVSRI